MRIMIGQCNNADCSQFGNGLCGLSPDIVHEFQYDHDTGLLSCQFFVDEQAEGRTSEALDK